MVIFIRPFFLQGSDNVEVMAAGLPNITGNTTAFIWGNASNPETVTVGAITHYAGTAPVIVSSSQGSGNFSNNQKITFNASNSNSIYGNSDTVQPSAISLIPQIKF